jgi:ligand-binding SRPBCC domain-containing protein
MNTIQRARRTFFLESQVVVAGAIEDVFRFFADAGNLERLTPPWLRFQILTQSPIEMRVGARIDYRLRVRGIPLRWQSEITAWEPPRRFLDEQRRGPYRLWVHEHTFESVEGGTRVRDHVAYAVPGGWLVQRWFVGPDLQRIFEYRRRALQQMFANSDGRNM